MVAQLKPTAEALPLLAEPLEPNEMVRRCLGWVIETKLTRSGVERRVTRNHADDERGAFAQHIVVRYLVHGVHRQQISQESSVSQRQVQGYAIGRVYEPYTLAVLRDLKVLGITLNRGRRQMPGYGRMQEIVEAQRVLLNRAGALLAYWQGEDGQEIARLIHLLSAGKEPVPCQ